MDAQLARFFRSWCAPELSLLGFRLAAPYCLGHSLLLEAIESPFTQLHEPEAVITPEDLLRALCICAGARFPFRFVSLRPSVWTRLLAWWLHRHPDAFTTAVETFCAWLAECSGLPEFWQDEDEKSLGGLTAPAVLAQACKLLRKTPLTEERVWTMPLGLISWYYGTLAEQEGTSLRFAYDEETDERSNPPDLNHLSEEQLYELVVRDRGPEFAAGWLRARKGAASCPA